MPDVNRIYCSRCGESVYNCTIDTAGDGSDQRIPVVHRIISGQVPDSGPPVDLCATGVRVTSFTREVMATPLARVELGERCFAEVFGLPRLDANEDPMFDTNNNKIPDRLELNDEHLDASEKGTLMHRRSLHALLVGRGAAKATDLPPEFLPPSADPVDALKLLSDEQLEAMGLMRKAKPPAEPVSPPTPDQVLAG